MAATPCNSMSPARRAPVWSRMPHRLRSAEFPYGLSEVTATDQRTIEKGNLLAKRVGVLIQLCIRHGVPVAEENPVRSYLWLLHGRQARNSPWRQHEFDQCSLGTGYRKTTRIDGHGVIFEALARRCENRRKCSFTGKPHAVLTGTKDGVFVTRAAARYPRRLCEAIATGFGKSWVRSQQAFMWNVFRSGSGHC